MDENNKTMEMTHEEVNESTKEISTKQVRVRKLKVGPLIAIIVLVLIVTGVASVLFTYNRFVNDPVKIFTKAINVIYKEFHEELKNIQETENTYFNIKEESLNVEADVNLDGTYMNFNQLKDNLFKISYGIDYKNDLVTMGASIKENNENLIDATLYSKGKKTYLDSNSLFDNIYSIDSDENIFETIDINEIQDEFSGENYSVNDLDDTVKALKEALISSLDEESMSIKKEKIEINNEKINTNKISYKLNKESTKKLFSSVAKIILDDEELLKNLSMILKVDKEDLKKGLNDMLDDKFYEDFTNEDNMEFAIYTTGLTYKFVKAEIINENMKIELINYKEIHKITLNDFKNNGIYEINIKVRNDIETLTFTYNKEQILKLVIKENTKEKCDLEYEIKSNDAKYEGTLLIELKAISETEANGSIKFTCDMNSGTEKYDLQVNANYKVLVGTKIEDNKLDKAIDIKGFKEEDNKKLEDALKKIENSNFYKYLLGLMGGNALTQPNASI